MKKFWTFINQWILNKYVLTITVFAFILTFCGPNSLINSLQTKRKIRVLEHEIENYDKNIRLNTEKINELESNKNNLEKFAREQYLMKENGEDIYLIDEDD